MFETQRSALSTNLIAAIVPKFWSCFRAKREKETDADNRVGGNERSWVASEAFVPRNNICSVDWDSLTAV